jgi:hypothetical protein
MTLKLNAFPMEANWKREIKRYSYKISSLQPRFGYRNEARALADADITNVITRTYLTG